MKIVLNSVDDLRDLIGVMDPEFLRTWQPAVDNPSYVGTVDTQSGEYLHKPVTGRCSAAAVAEAKRLAALPDEPDGLPIDMAQPAGVATTNEPGPGGTDEQPERDADGAPYNTDWHSDPAKINADGRWRARRKRDEHAYKAWLLEQAVEVAEAAIAADAEPVATETHALPQDDGYEVGDAPQEPDSDNRDESHAGAPTVDLAALVEASQEAALDASDSHMDLIKACQQYIEAHGHPAYNALKAAVAPLEGSDNGKAIPQFTPGERRLMRACMANYPQKEA